MWQLPHFYGLAYWNKDDYQRAGFKMLPSIDADGTKTYRAMARASAGLAAWSIAVPAFGFTSYMFAPTGLAIAALQFYPVWRFGQHCGSMPPAMAASAATTDDAALALSGAARTLDARRMHWGKWSFIVSLASLPLMLLGMIFFGKGSDNQVRLLDSPLRRHFDAAALARVEDAWANLLSHVSSSKPTAMCPHVALFKHAQSFCPVKIVTPSSGASIVHVAAPDAPDTHE